jgi:ankyrin repeat protein
MSKSLPARANLDQLKKQAKELLKSLKSGDPEAQNRFREDSGVSLHNAQRVIAREYGFSSWAKLKEHVESLELAAKPMNMLKTAITANDAAGVRLALRSYPELKLKLNEALPEGSFGQTPLLAAVRQANKEMIDALLEAGADINQRSHWWAGGFGVLDNDGGLALFLIERGARVDAYAAARLGMIDKLKEIIAADRRAVDTRGGDGQTPLHVAATVEIAECLLEHGAMIDTLDVDHESTPAQYLVRDHQDVARYLVSRGCRTDLLMATALGDMALVRKHLEIDPGCIRMVVSADYFPMRNPHAGGTIYIWTLGQNKTAHMIAREFGHEEIFQLLMERSPLELKLAQACELGDDATFAALLASRPTLAQRLSDEDRRKVADAAQSNNIKAVQMMLAAGWPVDARGQHGATALHWAGFHGNVEMAREILRHNPPLEATDRDFEGMPLGWTMYGSVHGWHNKTGNYAATAEAVLAAGAKLPEKIEGTPEVQAVVRAAKGRRMKEQRSAEGGPV